MKVLWSLMVLCCINICLCCDFTINGKAFSISSKWIWKAVEREKSSVKSIYSLSFCDNSMNCGSNKNVAVCRQSLDKGGKNTSYGKILENKNVKTAVDGKGFELTLKNGDVCAKDKSKQLTSKINFVCGKTLGELEFLEQADCVSYFRFSTNEACREKPPHNQFPCYLINSRGQKHDLAQLEKSKGAYRVISFTTKDFFLNVCGDIRKNKTGAEKDCPDGVAACIDGNKSAGRISPNTALKLNEEEKIELMYEDSKTNCSTSIVFECANSQDMVTNGPVLLNSPSTTKCLSEIHWTTHAACPVGHFIARDSCTLKTREETFDLTPLQRDETPWQVERAVGHDKYKIYLNLCKPLKNLKCNGNDDVSVCQRKTGGDKSEKVLGTVSDSKLRYMDGLLTYVLSHGERCNSWANRSTIVTFTCDPKANPGKPVFSHDDSCTYFIDWPTMHACYLKRAVGGCFAHDSNQTYDLMPLQNNVFDVINSKREDLKLSVCALLPSNNNSCGGIDSSLCNAKTKKSFGRHISALQVLPDKSLMLNYTHGSECSGQMLYSTTVIFLCSPGVVTSLPTIAGDECHYTIMWETAHACPLKRVTGHRCRLEDIALGVNIDLSYIKYPQGKDYLTTMNKEHEYQIKLCSGSTSTSCNHGDKTTPSISGCQVNRNNKDTRVIGKYTSSSLRYYEGLLQMTLRGGDRCKNGDVRTTHLSFACDVKETSVPRLEFVAEDTHCFYRFNVHTKYACLPKPGKCTIESGGKRYDLSALSRTVSEDAWTVTSTRGTYYLNVCRQLPSHLCSPFAAACFKHSMNAKEVDYGGVAEPPSMRADDTIIVRYRFDNGTCGTEIQLKCSEAGQGAPHESTEKSAFGCVKVFTWSTTAACAVHSPMSNDNCTVTSRAGTVFNLASLANTAGYTVVRGNTTYKINVCASVTNGCQSGFAACVAGGKQIGKTSKKLEIDQNGVVTLEYKDGDPDPKGPNLCTRITFYCNGNDKPQLRYERHENYVHYFSMGTSVVCEPYVTQCKREDARGWVYDLQPLEKKDGYWQGLSRDKAVLRSFINVCYPLKHLPASTCPGSPRACLRTAVQTYESYLETEMKVFGKMVSIDYFNKQPGFSGHKMKIFFHCSSVQGSPFYFTTVDDTLVFNWLSPTACPMLATSGNSCTVVARTHVYNFTQLPPASVVLPGQKMLMLKACGKNPMCDGDSAACILERAKKTNIGNTNDNLQLNKFGELSLHYKNGDVNTDVKFTCATKQKLTLNHAAGSKSYEITWATPFACKPRSIDCSIATATSFYDLSVLARSDVNWRARVDKSLHNERRTRVLLNVCRPLVRADTTTHCSPESALCIVGQNSNSINLGEVVKSPYLDENGDIILEYGSGDLCRGDTILRYSARVRVFQGNAKELGDPYMAAYDRSTCTYYFSWETSAAWPLMDVKRQTETTQDCTVEDKGTGQVFDMRPLYKKQGYTVNSIDGTKKYRVSVCGPLRGVPGECSNATAICETTTATTKHFGAANKVLLYNEFLYMKFLTADGKRTLVTFVCDESEEESGPELVYSTESVLMFTWRTVHACKRHMQCTAFAEDGREIDLSPLTVADSYSAKLGGKTTGKYYVNVCRTVIGRKCPHSSAVCQEHNEKGVNLGRVTGPPEVLGNGEVRITYTNGDACGTGQRLRSTLIIACNKDAKTPAVAVTSVDECTASFRMLTDVVCPNDDPSGNCVYNGVDFKTLRKSNNADYLVKSSADKSTQVYHINLCQPATACANDAVCLVDAHGKHLKSLGVVGKATFTSNGDSEIFMRYKTPASTTTTINFECDQWTVVGSPHLVEESAAATTFGWKSSVVCREKPAALKPVKNQAGITVFDFKDFKQAYNFEASLRVGGKVSDAELHVYLGSHRPTNNKPPGCPKTAAVCLLEPLVGRSYVLGLVEKPLVTAHSSDNTIKIVYADSNHACAANGFKMTVRFTFSCGKSNVIQYDSFDSATCKYSFRGTTPRLCNLPTKKPQITARAAVSTTAKPTTKNTSGYAKRNRSAIAFLAVGLMAAVFLICLGVLLSNPQRREAFINTWCTLIGRKTKKMPTYRYKQLDGGGSSDENNDEEGRVFCDVDDHQGDEGGTVHSYHDTSSEDEELLPI